MKQFSKHKQCEEKHFLFEIRAKVPDYVILTVGAKNGQQDYVVTSYC